MGTRPKATTNMNLSTIASLLLLAAVGTVAYPYEDQAPDVAYDSGADDSEDSVVPYEDQVMHWGAHQATDLVQNAPKPTLGERKEKKASEIAGKGHEKRRAAEADEIHHKAEVKDAELKRKAELKKKKKATELVQNAPKPTLGERKEKKASKIAGKGHEKRRAAEADEIHHKAEVKDAELKKK